MLAMLQKEWMETVRSRRLLDLVVLFVVFGIMSPAIAKITPLLMEMMAESLAETGLAVTEVHVDALTSWTQYYKNIPLALAAFVILYSNILTKEMQSGTLVLLLTKGLARWKVITAKLLVMITAWSCGYWLCYAITYGYNAYFWDNSVAVGLVSAAMCWWIFGLWAITLLMLFSVVTGSSNGAIIGTGVCALAAYLLSMIPKAKLYSPAQLMGGMALMREDAQLPVEALMVTFILSIASIAATIIVMNRK